MIKKFIFITFFSLQWSMGSAQTKEAINSLHYQLATAVDDSSRINTKIALCALHRLGNTDSSNIYGQEAIKESREINYPAGEILARGFMSINLEGMGNYPEALEMAFKALQIAKETNLEQHTSPALNAIGEVYMILKDYPRALYYLKRQQSILGYENNPEGVAYSLKDIAAVYEEINQLDSASYYMQKAIEMFRKTKRDEPLVYETLGNIQMKLGHSKEALNCYQKSLRIALENNERRASAVAYNKIATFYKEMKQPDSGIHYAIKGLKESEMISQKKTLLQAALLLADFYENTDSKEAFRYLKIADTYKDSLFGTGNLQAIQALVTKEEEYQKKIEAERDKYQNQLKQYALIVGILILLIIAFILYRNNRQKQKSNSALEKAYADLKASQSQLIQSEKMASLGELTAGIAHEIQNPLNFVNNFSEVNTELIEEMQMERSRGKVERNEQLQDELLNSIAENEKKISHHGKRADAIVKGMLQHSRSSSGQKEPTDINVLADEYLRLAYHGLRARDNSFNASMKTDFDKSIRTINIVPQDIGRVILNLITNAFYAVGERSSAKTELESYEPTVSISTGRVNGKIQIKVKDNGNGIPQKNLDKIFQPFFTTKPTGQGTGLGLSLSYDIVKAHGGELIVETQVGIGTEFIIQLNQD